MKYAFFMLLALLTLCLSAGFKPASASNKNDTMMKEKERVEKQDMHAAMMGRMMENEGREQGYENSPSCNEPCETSMMGMNRMHSWREMYSSHRHTIKKALAIVCMIMLLCAIINILLTILVILDMTKTGRFNGLWVPLLLIIGVPATALYAMFRIGDSIRFAAEQKKQ